MYDSSFYMFPRTKWSTKLNGVEFHFDHRLYMSTLIRDLKISQLNDLEYEKTKLGKLILDADYDVLISGHLHTGFVYTGVDFFGKKDKIYLGIPSASNTNIGGVVGMLIYMYPDSNNMEVSILGCSNDLNIYEVDRIEWSFNEKNKTYRRGYR